MLEIALPARQQFVLGRRNVPDVPAPVHVLSETIREDRSVIGRQIVEEHFLALGRRFRQAIVHVEEVLLIVVESAPCVDSTGTVFARTPPLGEESSRKVVFGLTLGENPARDTQALALAAKCLGFVARLVGGAFPVTVDDDNQSRTNSFPLRATFNFGRHLALAAHAIESDGPSHVLPILVKRLVQFRHDALQERSVAVTILDEYGKRFLGEHGCKLGRELIRILRTSRHTYASFVRRRTPCFTPNRRDEHLTHAPALPPLIASPERRLEGFRLRLSGGIPHVPAIVHLVQNPIQPLKSLRIVCRADINLDSHRLHAIDRLARRMARISS